MYEPTEVDITWAREMIDLINEGGTLAYPATELIYTLHHHEKLMVLQNPEIIVNRFDSFVIHLKTTAVFGSLGWRMAEMWGGRSQ